MAPNAGGGDTMSFQADEQNQIDQDSSEEKQFEKEDDIDSPIDRNSDKSTVSLCFTNVPLKFNLLQLLFLVKYYIKRTYIAVWRKYSGFFLYPVMYFSLFLVEWNVFIDWVNWVN